MFTLRPYQQEAIDALHGHLCAKQTNPCVVIPTGGGKSVIMAETIRRWKDTSPWVRGCVLAHRQELVEQNAAKLRDAYPGGEIGVFSAGLGQRDYDSPILFASIDSIFRKAGEFAPFDFLFVDEAHRIPPKGEGKYRTFITGCQKFNENLRTVGWTATAFRMGCGPICHRDHILNEVCYEAKITDLIAQGFLSNLRSKIGEAQPDLKKVRKNNGDYVVKSLAEAVNSNDLVSATVAEACRIMAAEQRRSAVFFCVDLEHCDRVSQELRKHGVYAPCITGKTKKEVRAKLIADFKAQTLHAICCVNVLTEGFDAPHVDTIVLLRPTLSAGLFAQMVGRGLRWYSGKDYCRILDFAGCIDEHGPIDLLGEGLHVALATCPECREAFSRVIGACPQCGWIIPPREVERLEATEKERRMHSTKASDKSILSSEPEVLSVSTVYASRHCKEGSPDSLKVQYRCGLRMVSEWACLDHDGFAGRKAASWWRERFGSEKQVPTVSEALGDLFLTQTIHDWTKTISVRKSGRYTEIIGYNAPLMEKAK